MWQPPRTQPKSWLLETFLREERSSFAKARGLGGRPCRGLPIRLVCSAVDQVREKGTGHQLRANRLIFLDVFPRSSPRTVVPKWGKLYASHGENVSTETSTAPAGIPWKPTGLQTRISRLANVHPGPHGPRRPSATGALAPLAVGDNQAVPPGGTGPEGRRRAGVDRLTSGRRAG